MKCVYCMTESLHPSIPYQPQSILSSYLFFLFEMLHCSDCGLDPECSYCEICPKTTIGSQQLPVFGGFWATQRKEEEKVWIVKKRESVQKNKNIKRTKVKSLGFVLGPTLSFQCHIKALLGLSTFIYVLLIVSAPPSPSTPLPSCFTVWSIFALTILMPCSLVFP